MTLSLCFALRPSELDWNATNRPSVLTESSLANERLRGAGSWPSNDGWPLRIAVLSAGKVAASAAGDTNRPRARRARARRVTPLDARNGSCDRHRAFP